MLLYLSLPNFSNETDTVIVIECVFKKKNFLSPLSCLFNKFLNINILISKKKSLVFQYYANCFLNVTFLFHYFVAINQK